MSNHHEHLSGILAYGCSFEGVILFDGLFRIDGIVKGKIICRPDRKGSLIIGDKAKVDVDLLMVDNLYVAGECYGNGPVIVLQDAEFHSKSRVEVNKQFSLYSSHLVIKEKALFQGKSVMIRHESEQKKEEIRRLVFENHHKTIVEPFEPNPVLNRPSETLKLDGPIKKRRNLKSFETEGG